MELAFIGAGGRQDGGGWASGAPAAGVGTSPAASALVQHDGTIELPAVGRWGLHRTSCVYVAVGRRLVRLPVTDGWLDVGPPRCRSTLVIVAGDDRRTIRLDAHTMTVRGDHNGLSRWPLTGIADDHGTSRDVDVGLSYHGVHRNGDAAWARFTGTAQSPPDAGRWRRPAGLALTLDLLLAAPTATLTGGPLEDRAATAA